MRMTALVWLVAGLIVACGDDTADTDRDASTDTSDPTDGSADTAVSDVGGDTAADVEPGDVIDPDGTDSADVETDAADADIADSTADAVEPTDSGDASDSIDGSDATPDTVELFEVDVCALTAAGPTTGDAWISIGAGNRSGAWLPMPDPPTLVIGQGLQGGYHLWSGFEANGLAGEMVDTNWCVTDTVTDTTLGQAYLTNALAPLDDHFSAGGLTVFLDFSVDPTTLAEHPLRVCVAAKALGGAIVSDCETVTATCCDYLDAGGP